MLQPTKRRARRGSRERGTALLIVLMFIVAMFSVLAILLPTVDRTVRTQGATERNEALRFVLLTALEDCRNELITGDYANQGSIADGVGAKGTGLDGNTNPTTAGEGVEVFADGASAGFYRVAIDGTNMPVSCEIFVVAAWPNFDNVGTAASPTAEDERREVLACRVTLFANYAIFGDRSAFSFAGAMGTPSTGNFGYSGTSGHRSVTFIEPSNTYPAITIGDQYFYDDHFKPEFMDVAAASSDINLLIQGIHKTTGTANATGADTIAIVPANSQLVSARYLSDLAQGWIDYVNDGIASTLTDGDGNAISSTYTEILADSGNTINTDRTGLGGSLTDFYHIRPGAMNTTLNGAEIQGAGTLLISRSLAVNNSAVINWSGNVILYGGAHSSSLDLSDADMNVTGNLVLVVDPLTNKRADLHVDKNGDLDVRGANGIGGTLMAITAGAGQAQIHVTSTPTGPAKMYIYGIMSLLGDSVDMVITGSTGEHAICEVRGSTILAGNPSGSGVQKLTFSGHTDSLFEFNSANFDSAINGLQPPGKNPPPPTFTSVGYFEPPGKSALWEQEVLINDAAAAGEQLDMP